MSITKGIPKVLKQETTVKTIVESLRETFTIDRKKRLHAGDSGFCSRSTVLNASYSGPGSNDAKSMLYMRIGSAVHDLIQNSLFKSGHLMFKEYKVMDIGVNLGGYVDIIAFINGRLTILELKTAGTSLPPTIKDGHRQQASIYSIITGLPAEVVYISRNVAGFDGRPLIKTYPLSLTRQDAADIMFQTVYAYLAVNNDVVGPIPAHMNESKCGYCSYKEFCWRGGEVPNGLRKATNKEHRQMIIEANETVEKLLDPVAMNERRTFLFNFLRDHGTEHAQKLFKETEDWTTLYQPPFI